MKRREFTDKVKLEIFRRAGGPDELRCESKKCRLPIKGRNFEIDHVIEEWERVGDREKLTAEDGQLLCFPCHDEKTGKKAGERAHGKRIVKKAAGISKKKSPGFRGWRKMNGDIVWRK